MALADRPAPRGARPVGPFLRHVCVVSDPDGSGWLMQENTEQLAGWV
jgi:hypothetical protein